jgi:glycosyltransferase involved in cell wall biosynthesis
VPCHNAAPWLAEALGSALDQSWRRLEVVVVDDGSTDASLDIANRFAGARCRVVHQEKRGASAARNQALILAQGEVIQYLDADDFLAPDKVERQIISLESDRSLSWSSVVHLLPDGSSRSVKRPVADSDRLEPISFLTDLWGGNGQPDMVAVHQWLAPRRLIEEAGPWNENLTVDDDGEFFARVLLAAEALIHVPESTCFYRKFRRGENLSASIFNYPRHRQSAMKAAQLKIGYLLAQSDDAKARRAASYLITQEIVAAYPNDLHLVDSGMNFLQERGLELSSDIDGSPWFRRARALLGWKAARRLQHSTRIWRRRGAIRDSTTSPAHWAGAV